MGSRGVRGILLQTSGRAKFLAGILALILAVTAIAYTSNQSSTDDRPPYDKLASIGPFPGPIGSSDDSSLPARPEIGPREVPRERLPESEPAPWVELRPDAGLEPRDEPAVDDSATLDHDPGTLEDGQPVSDDFNRLELDDRWSFVDPSGRGTLEFDGTRAKISVPMGQSHDVWVDGSLAPRLMQPVADTDFALETKFESLPTGINAMQGFLIEGSDGQSLRFDVYSREGGIGLFAASISDETYEVYLNQGIPSELPLNLRIHRTGDEWTFAYKADEHDWQSVASAHMPIAVQEVGVFAGNAGTFPPAHTAVIDYVFNTRAPITEPNANQALDTSPPEVSHIEHRVEDSTITVSWTTDRPSRSTVAYSGQGPDAAARISTDTFSYFHEVTIEDVEPLSVVELEIESTADNGTTTTKTLPVYTFTGVDAPVIDVWYGAEQSFGHIGNPQRWVNILGRVSSANGISSLAYTLNGGASSPLSVGPNGDRLVSPGDFNIELDRFDLVSGANSVVITATDNDGVATDTTVTVTYTPDRNWTSPYEIDWSTVDQINDVAQAVDGLWTLTDDGVRTVDIGYDRLIGLGDIIWDDFEVEVPITMHGFGNTYPPGVGVIARWAGHYPHSSSGTFPQPRWEWRPMGGMGWYAWSNELNCYRLNVLGDTDPIIEDEECRQLELETPYMFKFRVETINEFSNRYSFKVWPQGEVEPEEWDLSAVKIGELSAGSVLLVAHDMDATFGNVSVTPLAEPVPPLPDEGRVAQNLQSMYTFAEGSGTTVHDVSGVGTPLNLELEDPDTAVWGEDESLTLSEPGRIISPGPASELIDSLQASNSLTLEAWITPAEANQSGPARIVTISNTLNGRNLTLGQGEPDGSTGDRFDVRLRTTATNLNGEPSTWTPAGAATTNLAHVVFTRSSLGITRIYVNGNEVASRQISGDLSNWGEAYRFALGNEIDGERPWLGTLHLVALFDRSLTPSEITHNFGLGPTGEGYEPPPPEPKVTWIEPAEGATLDGVADLRVDAPDETQRIEFTLENNQESLPIETATAPDQEGTWSIEIDTTNFDDGSWYVHAEAFDNEAGGEKLAGASRAISILNDTPTRVTTGMVALFDFEESSGATVNDVSGAGEPVVLQIEDTSNAEWGNSSLTLTGPTRIASSDAPERLIDSFQESNALTIEAWVQPQSASQSGPARMISMSDGLHNRNFTVGHGAPHGVSGAQYDVRLRTTDTSNNGQPSLTSPTGSASDALQHIVYTRSSTGAARLFIDGTEVVSGSITGNLSNWDSTFRLALGNEINEDRPWLGTYHLIVMYDRALSSSEVQINFNAGVDADPGGTDPPPPEPVVNWIEPDEGSVISETVLLRVTAPEETKQVTFTWETDTDAGSIGTVTEADGEDVWTVEWDTTTVPDAGYVLTATAFDQVDSGSELASEARGVVIRNEPLERVGEGLLTLYNFQEGSGSIVHDVSGVGDPLDLDIEDPGAVTWENGSLDLTAQNRIASSGPASKVIDGVQSSNEITVEAWITPQMATQSGPARIVTISDGLFDRNFTLGHGDPTGASGSMYDARLRTTSTNSNGQPSVSSPSGSATTGLQHVVYVRSASGEARLFIDGVEVSSSTVSGNFGNWNQGYRFALGNEIGADRPWSGTYHLVALYNRALSSADIQHNYHAGPDAESGSVDPPPPVPEVNWQQPAEGAIVSELLTLSVSAPDETQRIEFLYDDGDDVIAIETVTEIGSDGNWTVEWDTTSVADGAYLLVARAFDSIDGGEPLAESTRSITVQNETPSRVTEGLVALYEFSEGDGATVADTSGNGDPIDLTIEDPATVDWQEGSLRLNQANRIASEDPPVALVNEFKSSNAITVEAWITPESASQSGPARVVTISDGLHHRNVTLGQGHPNGFSAAQFESRLRTSSTNMNGQPSISSPANSAGSHLQHVVYTRSADGNAHLYIDGEIVASDTVSGDLGNWDDAYRIALGNEIGTDRPWLGTYHLVALYNQAIPANEVALNFAAGPDAESEVSPPDDSDPPDEPDPPGDPDQVTWQAFNTDWMIENNLARMGTQHGQGRLLVDAGTTDHAVEATIDLPAGPEEHYAGVYVRYEDEANFIHARYLEQAGNSEIEVFQRRNGVDRLIIFMNFHRSVNGTVRTIRLAAHGNEVAVYDNGELVGQGITDLTDGTRTGIGAFANLSPAGIATWDDVTVSTALGETKVHGSEDLLFHDAFTTDVEPPIEGLIDASPGPGQWSVTNSADRLRINHGTIRAGASQGWGDPALWTSSPVPADDLGAFVAVVRIEGATQGTGVFLSDNPNPANPLDETDGIRMTTRNIYNVPSGHAYGPPGTVPETANRSVDHLISVIPRPGGGKFVLVSGGRYPQFPDAALLIVDDHGAEGELFAGITNSPTTNVSFTDVRLVAPTGLPEGFLSRFGIASTVDKFASADPSSGLDLHHRTADKGDSNWHVTSGTGTVNADEGYLEQSGNLYAIVESEPGRRKMKASFTLGTGERTFGLVIRSSGPDGGTMRFAYIDPLSAWLVIDDEQGTIWSTGGNTSMIEDGARIDLTIIDKGEHIRAFANGADLSGGAWIPVSQRSGAAWAGIYSGTNDTSIIHDFVVWPGRVTLTDAFDAKGIPPNSDVKLAEDGFNDADGTDLDGRPLQ